jgi:hypothetical protein
MKSVELFDETLDINATENYELAVQASPDGFHFCLLDTLRNKFVLIRTFEPEEGKYFTAGMIKDIISRDDFLTKSFRKARIVTTSRKFTLVPAPLFDSTRKDEYFTFSHGNANGSVINSNKVSDPDAFVVFSFPSDIHDALATYLPYAVRFMHLIPLFDHAARERRTIQGNYIHAHIEREFFNLLIYKGNKLVLCNAYGYRTSSDILYFIMNAFNKLEIRQEETIWLSGDIRRNDSINAEISPYIRTMRFSQPLGSSTFSYVFEDIDLHRFLNLFSVFNCG